MFRDWMMTIAAGAALLLATPAIGWAQDQAGEADCKVTKGVRFVLDFTVVSKEITGEEALSDELLRLVNEDCERGRSIVERWWSATMERCKAQYDDAIAQRFQDSEMASDMPESQLILELHEQMRPCRHGFINDHFGEIAADIQPG